MCDYCIFVKKFGDNDFVILLLYVDDMLIVGQDASKIDNLKKELSKSFAMKDLGLAKHILGMFSVCLYARFQSYPEESHLLTVKRILCYLNGTIDLGL